METCPYCKGSGKVKSWCGLGKEKECSNCDGTGTVQRKDKYTMAHGHYVNPELPEDCDPNK